MLLKCNDVHHCRCLLVGLPDIIFYLNTVSPSLIVVLYCEVLYCLVLNSLVIQMSQVVEWFRTIKARLREKNALYYQVPYHRVSILYLSLLYIYN